MSSAKHKPHGVYDQKDLKMTTKDNHDLMLSTISQVMSHHTGRKVEATVGRDWSRSSEIVSHMAKVDDFTIKASLQHDGKTQFDAVFNLMRFVRERHPGWFVSTPLDDEGMAGWAVYNAELDRITDAVLAQAQAERVA